MRQNVCKAKNNTRKHDAAELVQFRRLVSNPIQYKEQCKCRQEGVFHWAQLSQLSKSDKTTKPKPKQGHLVPKRRHNFKTSLAFTSSCLPTSIFNGSPALSFNTSSAVLFNTLHTSFKLYYII